MPPPTASLLNLPIRQFAPAISVGTDICHIPRILKILTQGSDSATQSATRGHPGPGPSPKSSPISSPGLGDGDTTSEDAGEASASRRSVSGQLQSQQQQRHRRAPAWRFISRLLRDEELGEKRTRELERGLARMSTAEANCALLQDVRDRLALSKQGKEFTWRPVGEGSQSGGRWEDLLKDVGAVGSREIEAREVEVHVLRALKEAARWKTKYGKQGWRTPWAVVGKVVRGGSDDVALEKKVAMSVIEELDRRRAYVGERASVKIFHGKVKDTSGTVESSKGAVDVDVQGENSTDGAASTSSISHGLARSVATRVQSLPSVEKADLQHGLQDDINAFLSIEERLNKHLDEAKQQLLKSASFLAGRFAAKEAIQKAYTHRRLTFHDIAILPQPPNVQGSRPPRVLIIDESGSSAKEAKVSISHDGDYATATALIEIESTGANVEEGTTGDAVNASKLATGLGVEVARAHRSLTRRVESSSKGQAVREKKQAEDKATTFSRPVVHITESQVGDEDASGRDSRTSDRTTGTSKVTDVEPRNSDGTTESSGLGGRPPFLW